MSEKINVDFGGWIQKGFDIWKENLVTLIVSTVIACFVSGLSLGILGGAMAAGLTLIVLGLHDKTQPKPQIGDLFKGFQFFLPTLLFMLMVIGVELVLMLMNLIPCLGQIASIVIAIGLSTCVMFTFCFVVDKKLSVIDSIKASSAIVMKNFFPFVGLNIVAGAIAGAGVILCGIGVFATAPIAACIIVAAYRAIEGGESSAAVPPFPSSPVPPPPPAGIDISRPS